MNPEDVGRILDEVGERIGPAGEYAWSVLVTGQRVTGIVGLIIAVAAFAVAYALFRLMWWAADNHQARKEADRYYGDDWQIAVVLFAAGMACAFFSGVALTGTSLPSVLAPEYVVLRDFIGGLR